MEGHFFAMATGWTHFAMQLNGNVAKGRKPLTRVGGNIPLIYSLLPLIINRIHDQTNSDQPVGGVG